MTSLAGKAVVGKIGDGVGLQIEDGEGLFFARGIRAIAAVKKDRETAVRREGDGGGEVVDLPRMAGNFAEELAVRESRGRIGVLRSKRNWKNERES